MILYVPILHDGDFLYVGIFVIYNAELHFSFYVKIQKKKIA